MENVLRAERDGVVEEVRVAPGASVLRSSSACLVLSTMILTVIRSSFAGGTPSMFSDSNLGFLCSSNS